MINSKNDEIGTLPEALTAFLERDNPREGAEILLRGMLRITSSNTGFLGLVEDRAFLRILSSRRPDAPQRVPIAASALLGRALGLKEALLSENPQRDFPGDVLLRDAPPFRNFMLVPVHGGAEPLAVALVADRNGKYSQEDLARVLLPAQVFGVVLKNGRERRLAQKMEAVGRLAGGIAHDFNNLLTTILGQCDVLQGRLGGQDSLFGELAEIRGAGERAASLTRRLLAFGRKQPIQPRLLDLNDVVRGVTADLQAIVGEEIRIQAVFSPLPATVFADRGQLRQILVDLALNARDAMRTGGQFTIATSTVELDQAYVQEHPSAVAGPHVMMEVADTGAGMAPEVLSHVFEPFFTTQERGTARGLGLATVYGAVKQNGGSISVESEPGLGTTIRIYLPRQEGPAREFPEIEVVGETHGAERILLVDDDAMVRRLIRETLRSRGYEVLEAGSGEEALRRVLEETRAIDLLLTDLVMPGMGGREVAQHVQARWPGLPVLYMSGFSEEMVVRQGRLDPDAAFLPKPFSIQELLLKVRRVIHGRAN